MVIPARLQCATLAYSYMYMECICHCAIAILPPWETNTTVSIEIHPLAHWTACTRPQISGPKLMVSIEIHLLAHWTACILGPKFCGFLFLIRYFTCHTLSLYCLPAQHLKHIQIYSGTLVLLMHSSTLVGSTVREWDNTGILIDRDSSILIK